MSSRHTNETYTFWGTLPTMEWKTLLNSERARKSTNPGDHRVEFERDFDRAVFSTPVKRLQDKAQVFPLDPSDAVRTRLTHSLEVSTVARGLGTAVGQDLLKKGLIEPGMDRSIEAISATCGLIHDLGNPPFGHAGEDAIRDWFKHVLTPKTLETLLGPDPQLNADFMCFEGNAQSLRLVAKLQILADFKGLNLTFGTLSASCKYIAPSHQAGLDPNDPAKKKPGYFASENSLIKKIREETATGDARNPLTFLVEAADDIVYSVADIEDGIKKGIMTWREFKERLPQDEWTLKARESMENILKAGEPKIIPDLPSDVYAAAFRTAVIGILVKSVLKTFAIRYDSIMAGTYQSELVEDCDASSLVDSLKKIGRDYVYCTPPTLKLEIMGRKVIGDLMGLCWEGAQSLERGTTSPNCKTFSGKLGALLSDNYRRVFQNSLRVNQELPENYHRLQLVTDYVCGMTDTFAKKLHAELTNGT